MDRHHLLRERAARLRLRYRPQTEAIEARLLLTAVPPATLPISPARYAILTAAPAYQVIRPNTPVAPFGSTLATASFIDPSAHVANGKHVFIGQKSFVAPYVSLDAASGFIKIGTGSNVLDNARIIATVAPRRGQPTTDVLIGDMTSVGYGATIEGESSIGAYGTAAKPTGIGANALIDGATIEPGAIVGPLARVGPGVTVPSGMFVLPGANVTNNAQASNPALGLVEAIPTQTLKDLTTLLARETALALGYTNLYQGNSATGANPGVPSTVTGVNNGNLATVTGTSQEPGAATSTAATGINFEPTAKTGPKFIGPFKPSVEGNIFNFTARIIGDVRFNARANQVQHSLGRGNSIRADAGQPFKFASAPVTGSNVTITSQLGGVTTSGTTTTTTGALTFGTGFVAQQGVVMAGGGTAAAFTYGNNVTIGAFSVIATSSIGANATIGARSYIAGSTVPAGAVIPPGTIEINNVVKGTIQW
jgi:carbonic anhydrase/acetyltransferase-like protein (isoleucine patch superfamily)